MFRSLPNNKFRPVQMHAVTENSPFLITVRHNLSAPVIISGNEDANDYNEGFKKFKNPTCKIKRFYLGFFFLN
jgi:hypothetical protein